MLFVSFDVKMLSFQYCNRLQKECACMMEVQEYGSFILIFTVNCSHRRNFCSAVLRDGILLVGNVGDCRALLLSAGKPIQMSNDQKPTLAEEQRRIAALGGTVVYCMGVARVNG